MRRTIDHLSLYTCRMLSYDSDALNAIVGALNTLKDIPGSKLYFDQGSAMGIILPFADDIQIAVLPDWWSASYSDLDDITFLKGLLARAPKSAGKQQQDWVILLKHCPNTIYERVGILQPPALGPSTLEDRAHHWRRYNALFCSGSMRKLIEDSMRIKRVQASCSQDPGYLQRYYRRCFTPETIGFR